MREHLKRRGEIRPVAEAILQSYEQLDPKLQHLEPIPLPGKQAVIGILDDILKAIYPGYFGEERLEGSNIDAYVGALLDSIHARLTEEIYRSIRPACREADGFCAHCHSRAEDRTLELLRLLPELRRRLSLDVLAAYEGDPAARSTDEVIFSYPAIYTISVYRIAHELQRREIPLLPRIMTEHAHSRTGIDIHPGARIGHSFFIDHGTGVVIGETTIIGDRVKIYQGVTIGALSFARDAQGQLVRGRKRHPTIEDDVVIYSGATILGGDTVIGRGSVIGGNVWLTRSVPPRTRVVISEPELVIDSK